MQLDRLALALLMLTGITALAACTPQGVGGLPRFEAKGCPAGFRDLPQTFECGQLLVPETRGDPDSRVLRLFVSIARADSGSAPDPVVYVEGGPGFAPSASIPYLFDDSWLEPRETAEAMPPLLPPGRDVIFIDPRGTGRSRPSLDCGPDPLVSDEGLIGETYRAVCLQLNKLAGIDVNAYGSAEMAADIADLRTALGLANMNLWGVSHGTRVAMTVLRDRPQGVRSVVLDSPFFPENPDMEDWPWLVEREVRDIFAWCEADPRCAAAHAGTLRRFEVNAARWREAGVARIGGRTYAISDIASYLIAVLYDPNLAGDLPNLLRALNDGDDGALARLTDLDEGTADLQARLVTCSEEFPFESVARMRDKAGVGAIAQLVALAHSDDTCSELGLEPPAAIENQPVRSDVPILAMAAEIDPGCPIDYARAAARYLPNAQVVELVDTTHAVTAVSSCGRSLMAMFLDDPTKPVDTSCQRPQRGPHPTDSSIFEPIAP